jgi:hypothetical protein
MLVVISIGATAFGFWLNKYIAKLQRSVRDRERGQIKAASTAWFFEENLIWLVKRSIEAGNISRAKGSELLGIPLIDLDDYLEHGGHRVFPNKVAEK